MHSSIRFMSHHSRTVYFLVLVLLLVPALASAKARKAAENPRYAALVVDADTGMVLHNENAGKLRYPASLTKMMTLYLAFEALQSNKLTMDQALPVSAFAASRPRMNMGLKAGETITVREAILILIVRSANDVAVVLAESIGGNEPAFARKMTERAISLGMTNTVFRNASGLPDNSQRTTAYDLARLAIALRRDFPQFYPMFSSTNVTFKGRVWAGHNRLTSHYPGADGLKTGFVNASGFNLVTSAKRGNTKLVGVVMGGQTAKSRDKRMISLLDRYFKKVSGGIINSAYAGDDTANASTVKKKVKKVKSVKKTRAKIQQVTLTKQKNKNRHAAAKPKKHSLKATASAKQKMKTPRATAVAKKMNQKQHDTAAVSTKRAKPVTYTEIRKEPVS